MFAENLVELGGFALQADPDFCKISKRSITALAKMVETYTSKKLDKGKVRTSNWEAVPLKEDQKHCNAPFSSRFVALTVGDLVV